MAGRRANNGARQTITMVDVAREAGVSRSTVSLVLRNSPLVADATRARVQEAIRKVGYVYNRGAAGLRTRQSQTVGLVITDMRNPFFAELTVGVEAELDQASYVAFHGNTWDSVTKQSWFLDTIVEHRVDGILLCPAKGTAAESLRELRRQMPLVLFVRSVDDLEVDYVGADNLAGAERAVEHLIALGHRRIAFVGGPTDSSARRERYQGYTLALERAGLPVDARLVISSLVTRDDGYRAILEALARPEPPTAALCYNDVVAFGVMLGLRAAGRRVGNDFAVIGFDNVREAALWRPALTSVSIDPRLIGETAAYRLLDRVREPGRAPRRTILPAGLVIRESCGSPPG